MAAEIVNLPGAAADPVKNHIRPGRKPRGITTVSSQRRRRIEEEYRSEVQQRREQPQQKQAPTTPLQWIDLVEKLPLETRLAILVRHAAQLHLLAIDLQREVTEMVRERDE